jgi:hypothetical protein
MARMRINANGRWELYGGLDRLATIEITSGDIIYVEVEGRDGLQPTRIEFDHQARSYVSVDHYPLRDGLRAEVEKP